MKPTSKPASNLAENNLYGEDLQPGESTPGNYSASAVQSRGREFPEADCPTRGPFQRDRDRVIHASPFRRLTYKTQVFLFHEGDHYRTRLTHSLEVAQIARTLARQLRLDEDLAEVLALAHDLGHSPFGHAGERALSKLMEDHGGFDHNAQSLRIVTRLERKYRYFDGLNLTWETLEGLAKHNGPVKEKDHPIFRATRSLERWQSLDLENHASAEAQVAALADDIAYVNHDIDDGLRAGLLKLHDLKDAPLVGPIVESLFAKDKQISAQFHKIDNLQEKPGSDANQSHIDDGRAIYELNRQLISILVSGCVHQTRSNLKALSPKSPDDIRKAGVMVVAFSTPLASQIVDLKSFLFANVYRHPKVMKVMTRAQAVIERLFNHYIEHPEEMHARWRLAALGLTERARARLVSDFVSGMTDRLALKEYERLFDEAPELR